jgi:branched-chain amino acid transport system ATP-binding protein
MLHVDTLEVAHGSVTALRGVSLEVNANEIVAIIGANGAGKSTLLWTISGIYRPRKGEIQFEGARISGRRPEAVARRGITLVPEGRHVFASLTVRENLEMSRSVHKRRGTHDWSRDLELVFDRFPILADRSHSPAGQLSGGEQQQLVIGRALLCRPRLLLLDEPSLGLAPKVVESVFSVLGELRLEGVTVLLVEQAAALAVNLADRAYLLRNGQVEVSGTRQELLSRTDFVSAYFGEAS